MEIAVGLYIVGITLIMGYLINKYPRETIAIISQRTRRQHGVLMEL